MKRKNASLLGNVLMGLGLVVMVVGCRSDRARCG